MSKDDDSQFYFIWLPLFILSIILMFTFPPLLFIPLVAGLVKKIIK